MLSQLTMLITLSTCTATIVLDDPFVLDPNGTVSELYDAIKDKIFYVTATRGISIIFGGRVILEFMDDHRTISDIGMNSTFNDIQIIQKPIFVALLEMVSHVMNVRNIPWIQSAWDCLSDSSANHCQNVSEFGRGLHCDDNGNLIAVDLSHLNLSGIIHLESLPQTVRSLDLSFNDFSTLNLSALTGKSVEILNVEHNARCHINTEYFSPDSEQIVSIKELQLSSNQIFPWITDSECKTERIKHWLNSQQAVQRIIVDGTVMYREKRLISLHWRMLRVIEGVTNKEVIPWYSLFSEGATIRSSQWKDYGVHHHVRANKNARFRFDLSGLGLEGHIDLRDLPRNVAKMDLSNNNLQSISFLCERDENLRELNIENNDNIRFDLAETASLKWLLRLSVSSIQLQCTGGSGAGETSDLDFVPLWLNTSTLREIEVDGIVFKNKRRISSHTLRQHRSIRGCVS